MVLFRAGDIVKCIRGNWYSDSDYDILPDNFPVVGNCYTVSGAVAVDTETFLKLVECGDLHNWHSDCFRKLQKTSLPDCLRRLSPSQPQTSRCCCCCR